MCFSVANLRVYCVCFACERVYVVCLRVFSLCCLVSACVCVPSDCVFECDRYFACVLLVFKALKRLYIYACV